MSIPSLVGLPPLPAPPFYPPAPGWGLPAVIPERPVQITPCLLLARKAGDLARCPSALSGDAELPCSGRKDPAEGRSWPGLFPQGRSASGFLTFSVGLGGGRTST